MPRWPQLEIVVVRMVGTAPIRTIRPSSAALVMTQSSSEPLASSTRMPYSAPSTVTWRSSHLPLRMLTPDPYFEETIQRSMRRSERSAATPAPGWQGADGGPRAQATGVASWAGRGGDEGSGHVVEGAAGWEPDNDLETELWAMRQIGDRDGYLLGLARGGVLLPLSMDGEHGGAHWVVSEISGHRCVVSFTSADAMRRILPMPGHRPARFAELALALPDPSMALAVDPGLPIEAYLSHQAVVDLVELAAMPDDES